MKTKHDLHDQFAHALHHGDPQFAQSLGDALSKQGSDTGDTQTKAEANYHTSDTEEKCSTCKHFDGTSACDIVSGKISPDGVSNNYEPISESTGPTGDTPDQTLEG